MGIQGLLPLLKSIHKPTHLRNFAGQTLGVDVYGWLHRGTVSCAIELAQQKPTRKHIDFALSRVRMLIHFGVKPYLVFDGDYLPSKAHTEHERSERRKESKKLGLQLLAMGRISQAHLELQKAVDVTPIMARELIEELKLLDVPYVVAPYEADSQLAYLEKQGIISGVLSEDSDLLVFGVKCLLTKLDQYGECVMVNRADFTACREISLVGWTDKDFRMMAMLSGCDYLPGIEKMGLRTAYRLVRKHKNVERIVRAVQFDGKMKVQPGYLEAYGKAEKTFLYQRVFCPEARSLVHLNTLPADLSTADMSYIGQEVDAETAAGVATGDLHPNTKERIVLNAPRQLNSRARLVETPDEKHGKPISEFFKSKRIPLAELDPNSFTPSPSQQRLLQNQLSASWSASQIQAAPVPVHNRFSVADAPSSAPQPTRRTASSPWPDTHRVSPKRQRLCSDNGLATSTTGVAVIHTAASRFFSKPGAQASSSLRKTAESQNRKEEFELWSDDSVVEAVAATTTTAEITAVTATPSPKKRKKIQVFADDLGIDFGTSSEHAAVTESPSRENHIRGSIHKTSISRDDKRSALSGSAKAAHSGNGVFDKGIDARFARFTTLGSQFSFDSSIPPKPSVRTQLTSLVARSPLLGAEKNTLVGRLARPVPTAEKQRTLLVSSLATSEKSFTATSLPKDRLQDRENRDTIEDDEWHEIGNRQASDQPELDIKGSEDLLVPNSPDSTEEDGRIRPKLDLSHFAFAA